MQRGIEVNSHLHAPGALSPGERTAVTNKTEG